MLSKPELIQFILKNSADYQQDYLETLNIQSLVIIKVGIELTLSKKKEKQA